MGTNYYLHQRTQLPEPDDEIVLHIGKSSAGWCFSLRVVPDRGLNTLDDWIDLIDHRVNAQLGEVRDEYGESVSVDDLLDVITKRGKAKSVKETFKPGWGYATIEEFFERNNAEPGPNNLIRHKLGRYCVGHGPGTWDLIPGEFS